MRYAIFSSSYCPLLNITAVGYAADASVTRFGPGVRNSYIIHYVISGKGTFNGASVSGGQGFLITPGMHEHYFPDQQDPWSFVWFISNDPTIQKLLPLLEADSETGVFSFSDTSGLKKLATFLVYNKNTLHNGFEMLTFFLSIFQQQAENNKAKSALKADRYMEAAEKYIALNIQNPITVTELTDFLDVTQPYLFQLFKVRFGKSPKQYILEQKLAQARMLLDNTNLSVTHIANSVGFPDVLSFSRCFKSKLGISPQNYRVASKKNT